MTDYFEQVVRCKDLLDKLEQITFGDETVSVTHGAIVRNSLAKEIAAEFGALQAMVQGRLAYETKALMDAAGAPPNGELAEVWNDPVEENNGIYGWAGVTWIRSPYNALISRNLSALGDKEPLVSGFSESQFDAPTSYSCTVPSDGNGYVRWDLASPLRAGQSITLYHTATHSGSLPIAWLGDGAAANKSGGSLSLDTSGRMKSLTLTATEDATHLFIQQITTTESSLELDFIALVEVLDGFEHSSRNLIHQLASALYREVQALKGSVTSGDNALSIAIQQQVQRSDSIEQQLNTHAKELHGALADVAPLTSGYSSELFNGTLLVATTPESGNGYTRWQLASTLPEDGEITIYYTLSKTGATPVIWLGDGAAANHSGGTQGLVASGEVEKITLTSTGDATHLFIQQITGEESSLELSLYPVVGGGQSEQIADVFLSGQQQRKLIEQKLTDDVSELIANMDGVLAQNSGALADSSPMVSGYSESDISRHRIIATTPESGNGYTRWQLASTLPEDGEITIYYTLSKTGATPVIWLGDGAAANHSGGTQGLVASGEVEKITLTSTGDATHLFIQQYTASESTLDLVFMVLSGATETSQENALISFFELVTDVQNNQISTLKTTVEQQETQLSELSRSDIQRYPISVRNGLLVTTWAGNSQMIRRRYTNGTVAVKNVQIALPNWYVQPSGEQLPDNDELRVRVSIEHPIGSKPVHLYSQGDSTIVVPVGGTVTASELSGKVIPAGEEFYVHTHVEGYKNETPGAEIPAGRFYVHWSSHRDVYEMDGADITDQVSGVASGTAAPANLYSHVLLTGEPIYKAAEPALLFLGDSITYGFNENNTMTGDDTGAVGPYERWTALHGIGSINLSVASKRAADWVAMTAGDYPRTSALLIGIASGCVLALGRNDLANRTAAQLTADIATLKNFIDSAFGVPAVAITVTPASTSPDGFSTVENQTALSNNTERLSYNEALRNGGDVYLEVADAIESGHNSGVWDSDLTTDGIHPNSTAAARIASSLPAPATIFG